MAASDMTSHHGHDEGEWGLCKNCRWWQIEPEAAARNQTLGHCTEEHLLDSKLRVSGLSGCNHFMAGEPAHAAGAAAAPPRAEAAH